MSQVQINNDKPTVLITGANSGLGLEISRQYATAGWNVIATTMLEEGHAGRSDLIAINQQYPNLCIEQIDVTNTALIQAVAKKYQDVAIDVLINNAAKVESSFEADIAAVMQPHSEIDFDQSYLHFEVNAIGPMRMAQAFMPHVKQSKQKKMINVTSFIGSFGYDEPNTMGFNYGASKAALNLFSMKLAVAAKPDDIIVALVEPILVQTKPGVPDIDISSPVEVEVGKLIKVIENITMESAGKITNFTTGNIDPF